MQTELAAVLKEYVERFPAFRSAPIGAPHSPKRQEQDEHIALENRAKILIGITGGRTS